jgi:hypothetical protein
MTRKQLRLILAIIGLIAFVIAFESLTKIKPWHEGLSEDISYWGYYAPKIVWGMFWVNISGLMLLCALDDTPTEKFKDYEGGILGLYGFGLVVVTGIFTVAFIFTSGILSFITPGLVYINFGIYGIFAAMTIWELSKQLYKAVLDAFAVIAGAPALMYLRWRYRRILNAKSGALKADELISLLYPDDK